MIALDTIGYYLYMEHQENRSRESKQAVESEQASQRRRIVSPLFDPPRHLLSRPMADII